MTDFVNGEPTPEAGCVNLPSPRPLRADTGHQRSLVARPLLLVALL